MKPMMTSMTIAALGAIAAILVSTFGATRAMAAEPMTETAKLHNAATNAVTASDHAKVAKMYRLQGEALLAKAAAHEDQAKELEAQPKSPLAHKWPAMAPQKARKERELAMQAQRAARESLELATKHVQLAVEKREEEAIAGQ